MSVRRPRDGEISHQQGTLRVRSEERKEPQVGRLQLFGHEPYDSVQLLALLSTGDTMDLITHSSDQFVCSSLPSIWVEALSFKS